MWTCPKCASKVDPSFEVCWSCGTSPDGVVDPSFLTADEAGPIVADPLIPALDVVPDINVLSELPEPLSGDLASAYLASDATEARFLADQLNESGIQATCDTHDLRHTIGVVDADPHVWVRSEDLPNARAWLESYERNKVGRLAE